jgi:hypothetical protein
MKKSIQFCLVYIIIALLYTDCKKTEIVYGTSEQDLINTAKDYFTQVLIQQSVTVNSVNETDRNPRKRNPKTPLWDRATVVQLSVGKGVLVPIQYRNPFLISTNFSGKSLYDINQITKLLIYRDKKQNFRAELLTFFPDSNFIALGAFTGIVFVEDWAGNAITKYKIGPGKKILKWKGDPSSSLTSTVKTDPLQTNSIIIIQTCYEITGYNYSADDPGNVYYWSEPAGCTVNFIDDGASGSGMPSSSNYGSAGGGGGGGGISPAKSVIVNPGSNIIGNITDYDKCFTNTGGSDHLYQVMVCVSQPAPGTRETWGFSTGGSSGSSTGANPVNVGHTFLVFAETTFNGTICRNIGFYPRSAVTPAAPSYPGQLNNDDQHGYNISLTVTLNNSQFFNMLNYVARNSTDQYNLNTYNCTSFALQTLYSGGVILPWTTGKWLGGSGNDPGDLGEDIRSMSLSSNMTRNIGGSSHPNIGTCY